MRRSIVIAAFLLAVSGHQSVSELKIRATQVKPLTVTAEDKTFAREVLFSPTALKSAEELR
jgi:hypothetical protein